MLVGIYALFRKLTNYVASSFDSRIVALYVVAKSPLLSFCIQGGFRLHSNYLLVVQKYEKNGNSLSHELIKRTHKLMGPAKKVLQ